MIAAGMHRVSIRLVRIVARVWRVSLETARSVKTLTSARLSATRMSFYVGIQAYVRTQSAFLAVNV
jgi:hypothetical protein